MEEIENKLIALEKEVKALKDIASDSFKRSERLIENVQLAIKEIREVKEKLNSKQ